MRIKLKVDVSGKVTGKKGQELDLLRVDALPLVRGGFALELPELEKPKVAPPRLATSRRSW